MRAMLLLTCFAISAVYLFNNSQFLFWYCMIFLLGPLLEDAKVKCAN